MADKILEREGARRRTDTTVCLEPAYIRIGEGAFKNNIKIRKAQLSGVRVIGIAAFENCTALRQVQMPVMEVIRRDAFAGCTYLREVIFPISLKRLGKGCFSKCKRLAVVRFEKESELKELPGRAFAECRDMRELSLPDGLTSIGGEAFYKCDSLGQVALPSHLKQIGRRGFYQCGFQSLTLPEGLEFIGESAFLKCRNLTCIRIPESVRVIEKWAFHGCSRLKVLEIHHDPEIVGEWITNKDCTIRCRAGSKMEAYAAEYGIRTEIIT